MKKIAEQHNKVNNKRIGLLYLLTCALVLFVCGCESLRFAPSEAQKKNAWLHNRTAQVTAETAKEEDSSEKLQALTKLSELQSQAFVSYCGLPKEFPQAETAEDILRDTNVQLAHTALLGGVYGTRAVRFLKDAKTKSQALKEIIVGNEFFKKQNESSVSAFKDAHSNQSPQTRQIVTQMKA